jgi:small subunit ribosomal protein S16
MVKIRMQRMGAKKNPQYVIVATNEYNKRDGNCFEKLGFYYPKAKEASKMLTVDLERIAVWKAKGAQFSSTVEQLLKANAKTAS